MCAEKKNRFEYVMETFFKPNTQIKDLKGLLQLKVDTMKDFDENVVNFFLGMKVEKIKDLIEIKFNDVENMLIERKIPRETIDYVLITTKILKKLVEIRSKDKNETPTKVAIMGMQNAGKTSLINYLFAQTPDEQYKETEPTVSVDHKALMLDGHHLAVWDFGGQEAFRKEYLQNPDDFFVNTELLLFIVDSQAEEYYPDAIEYFKAVLEIMQKMNPKLHVVVDLHKYDPDLTQDIEFIVKTQWLEDKFKNILKGTKFSYEFMRTSIFSEISSANAPEIARSLKETLLLKKTQKEKFNELSLLKNILLVQARIYRDLMTSLAEVHTRLSTIESRLPAGTPPGFAPSAIPMFPPTPLSLPPPPPRFPGHSAVDDPKMNIVSELKEMFKKRRINPP